MKVFLDTNVVLDWIQNRSHAFAEEATLIIESTIALRLESYISAGTVYTLAYLLQKDKFIINPNAIMIKILNILNVMDGNKEQYLKACAGNFKDIEDAFQYYTAKENNQIQYFVTGNIKDFTSMANSTLPVITPKQMVRLLLKNLN